MKNSCLTDENLRRLNQADPQAWIGKEVAVPYDSKSDYKGTIEVMRKLNAKRIASNIRRIAGELLQED